MMSEDSKNPMIFEAISKVMMDIKHVGKEKIHKSNMGSFNFRGIDDLYNAIHAAMAKHDVFSTSEIIERIREEKTTAKGSKLTVTILRVKYTFHALDGSNVSTEVEGEAMDSGDKSTSKALSMADKYALIQMFKVPTNDIADADKESYMLEREQSSKPKITEEQAEEIDGKIKEYGINYLAFTKWLNSHKINGVSNIPTDFYDAVMAKVEEKAPQKDAA